MNLGQYAVGSTVFLRWGGVFRPFCVMHHGKPDADYDDSFLHGTILMLDRTDDGIILATEESGTKKLDYSGSKLHRRLQEDVLPEFDPAVQALIREVRLPYRYGIKSDPCTVRTGKNGLPAKIWAPSASECAIRMPVSFGGDEIYVKEGAKFAFWKGKTSADYREWACRKAQDKRESWQLRTPSRQIKGNLINRFYEVESDGDASAPTHCSDNIRPCLVLPDEVRLDGDHRVQAGQNVPVKTGGVWKEGAAFCREGGVWRECARAFIKENGVWRE